VTATTPSDEVMLAYLAGEDDVRAAATRIWDASGQLLDAQRHLEAATDAYTRAVTDAGIPAEHVERPGAALILRLKRRRLLDETDDTSHETGPSA